MSTPFLTQFSEALVHRMVQVEQLELQPGSTAAVVRFLAAALFAARQGSSLISTVERALIACPQVVELYADIEGIKAIVDDLRA